MNKNVFVFLLFLEFLLISCDNFNLTGENKKKYDEYEKTIYRLKLISCLNLIEKTVINNSEGNIDLIIAMRNTKLDKDKFYDKYILALADNCMKKITRGQLEYLIIPENMVNYNLTNKTNENLIKLDYEIKTLEYTKEEQAISTELTKRLEESIANSEKLKKKENKNKNNSEINWNLIIKVIAAVVPMVIFALFNQQGKNIKKSEINKNIKNEEKKEKKNDDKKDKKSENKEKNNKKKKE